MAAYKRMNYSETLIKGISLRPSFRLYRASAPLRQKSAYIMANWIWNISNRCCASLSTCRPYFYAVHCTVNLLIKISRRPWQAGQPTSTRRIYVTRVKFRLSSLDCLDCRIKIRRFSFIFYYQWCYCACMLTTALQLTPAVTPLRFKRVNDKSTLTYIFLLSSYLTFKLVFLLFPI